jgi:hypothetical protein
MMSDKVTSTENPIEGGRKMETRGGDRLKGVRILEKTQRAMVLLVLTFICLGCSGGAYIGAKDSGGPSRLTDEKLNHPPALVIGSSFVFQDTNLSNGRICKVIMTVKEKKQFEGKPAYWIQVKREKDRYFDIYDMNLNWIGSSEDGKELESAEPCIRVFDWPLKVGKEWSSDYISRQCSEGFRPSRLKISVKIRTYEEVTVPAGTFKTLRIQAGEETFWYAPSIGWAVKEEIEPHGKTEWLLELVKYRIPQS